MDFMRHCRSGNAVPFSLNVAVVVVVGLWAWLVSSVLFSRGYRHKKSPIYGAVVLAVVVGVKPLPSMLPISFFAVALPWVLAAQSTV